MVQIFTKYYRIEFTAIQGDFYILVPEYDGETIMNLTGLKVLEQTEEKPQDNQD